MSVRSDVAPGPLLHSIKHYKVEAATGTPLCKDQRWLLWIALESLAKRTDIYAQILNICLCAPHFPKDEFVGEHLARMCHQEPKPTATVRRG